MAEPPRVDVVPDAVRSLEPPISLVRPSESFEDAYARLAVRAHRVAYRILGVAADAEDVAAETLARASLRWNRLRPPADPWVVTVASRLAIDRQRKAWRGLPLEDEVPLEGHRTQQIDGLATNVVAHLDLFRALATLPKRQRQTVSLRYLSGYSEKEIALLLGCSASSVQTHTRRGLGALRTQLDVDALPLAARPDPLEHPPHDLNTSTRNKGADR